MAKSPSVSAWIAVLVVTVVASVSVAAFLPRTDYVVWVGRKKKDNDDEETETASSSTQDQDEKRDADKVIRIGFVGNSILYYNDCPRLVQEMLKQRWGNDALVHQDSCLRGGATLATLWEKGNGMEQKFATSPAFIETDLGGKIKYDVGRASVPALLESQPWDFVIMNDHTQAPAREESRRKTLEVLRKRYEPLLQRHASLVPVFLQTPAYRKRGMRNSDDLGCMDEFTDRIKDGIQEYCEALRGNNGTSLPDCRVAPVGEAVRWLYHNKRDLWEKLYSWDDFHPSPHGTWLQACVLYCTCFREPPGRYDAALWRHCRFMQPPDQKPLPRPTRAEAEELRQVACLITNLVVEDSYALNVENGA
jgi:hypothetical protein